MLVTASLPDRADRGVELAADLLAVTLPYDDRPSTITWMTSSAVAAKTAVFSSAPVPAVRGVVGVEGDQVGALPDRDRAGVVEAEAGVPVVRGRGQQLGRGPVAALAGWPAARRARPRASPRTGRSPRGCRCRASARLPASCSRAAGADAVAEVALGGGAEAGVGAGCSPSSRMSSSVRWVAWTAVVPRPSSAGVGEHLGRGAAVRRDARLVLGDLLGEVDVQRARRAPAPATTRHLVARHGADGVDRRADDDAGSVDRRAIAPVLTAQASAVPSE